MIDPLQLLFGFGERLGNGGLAAFQGQIGLLPPLGLGFSAASDADAAARTTPSS